jgi:hypothetical protein
MSAVVLMLVTGMKTSPLETASGDAAPKDVPLEGLLTPR